MSMVALARHAMATRFEIVLHGANEASLRAAGEEALREVERLEAQLSLYRPTSQIARLNARAAYENVRVTPELFGLLQQIQQLSQQTEGAFDVTIGPLMRCWGFMDSQGTVPDLAVLATAKSLVGMALVRLNEMDYTVRFERPGVMIDLGAVGKGYAVAQAAEIIRDAGIEHALIHGGTSTIYALGVQSDGRPWTIALETPPPQARLLAAVPLHNRALSVSAVWGRTFQSEGKSYGHVLDPRTGEPCASATMAAVITDSATEADALSTALLVRGAEGLSALRALRPTMAGLVLGPPAPGCHALGIELLDSPTPRSQTDHSR